MKMKKILIFIILWLFPISAYALSANSAIVMDLDSGRVLYEKNIHKEKLIASITKIMTAVVALENARYTDEVEIGPEILKSYGSGVYIQIGEKITLEELLYGLMLRSGNDAAMAIAKYIGGGMEGFVKLMNEKAISIGMENTVFYNSHGLEESGSKGNMSTSYDMAILTKYAMKNKKYKEIVSAKSKTVKTNYKTYVWTNKNKLLHQYKYTTGGKTGFTEKARRTLVTTATKDNKNLIIVTLNDPNDFENHKKFYETYFENYNLITILDKDNFKAIENYYKKDKLYIKNDYKALFTKNEEKGLKLNIKLKKIKNAENKDKIGEVEVMLKNKVIHKENVYLKKQEISQKTSFLKKISNWFNNN